MSITTTLMTESRLQRLRQLAQNASSLTGGRWVTIAGRHVYIKGGKVVAGDPTLLDEAPKFTGGSKSKSTGLSWGKSSGSKPSTGGVKWKPAADPPKSPAKKQEPEAKAPGKSVESKRPVDESRLKAEGSTDVEIEKLEKKLTRKAKFSRDSPPPPVSEDEGKEAAAVYSGHEYVKINRQLREGKPASDAEPKPHVENLQKLASQDLPEPTIVYRGLKGPAAEKMLSLNDGDEYRSEGFVSTSLDPLVAKSFSNGGVTLEIKAKRGLAIGSVSDQMLPEREVVQAHGTRYKVIGRRTGADGNLILMVDEV